MNENNFYSEKFVDFILIFGMNSKGNDTKFKFCVEIASSYYTYILELVMKTFYVTSRFNVLLNYIRKQCIGISFIRAERKYKLHFRISREWEMEASWNLRLKNKLCVHQFLYGFWIDLLPLHTVDTLRQSSQDRRNIWRVTLNHRHFLYYVHYVT